MFALRQTTPLEQRLSAYMSQVFIFMAIGSLLTAAVANLIENAGDLTAMHSLAKSPWLLVLVGLQLSFVFAVVPRVSRLSSQAAGLVLMETIIANSLIIVPVSYALFLASPIQGLLVAAFLFVLMAVLSRLFTRPFGMIPTFAIMGLTGWAFAMFVNLYFGEGMNLYGEAFNRYVVSLVAVVTVAGFTAWHGQQVRLLNMEPDQPFFTAVMRGTTLMALDYVYLVVRIPYQIFGEVMDLLGVNPPRQNQGGHIPTQLSLKAKAAPITANTAPVMKKKQATKAKKKATRRKP